MAKMFYTLAETAKKLGKSETEVIKMTKERRLQEFRDGTRLVFKVGQVEALAWRNKNGNDDFGDVLSIIKTAVDKLDNKDSSKDPNEDTGISIFDVDELDELDPNEGTGISIFDTNELDEQPESLFINRHRHTRIVDRSVDFGPPPSWVVPWTSQQTIRLVLGVLGFAFIEILLFGVNPWAPVLVPVSIAILANAAIFAIFCFKASVRSIAYTADYIAPNWCKDFYWEFFECQDYFVDVYKAFFRAWLGVSKQEQEKENGPNNTPCDCE